MERMVKRFEGRYTGVYSWHRNSLRFHRTGASGIIAWGDGYIELYIKLGLLLVPKRNQIEALIRQHLPTALREFAG
jgi:hypothetical protein